MISHGLKLIYIHPTKTGGTSIEHCLEPYFEINTPGKHCTLLEVQQMFYSFERYRSKTFPEVKELRVNHFDKYLKVCSVRDPWSRMYSLFKFHNFKRIRRGKISAKSPVDFFNFLNSMINRNPKNPIKHILPCYDYCLSLNDKADKEFNIDLTINQSNLQEDFNNLCDKLNIPKQNLPHNNKTRKHSNLEEVYNSESEELISTFFKKDIEFFNFKKPFDR